MSNSSSIRDDRSAKPVAIYDTAYMRGSCSVWICWMPREESRLKPILFDRIGFAIELRIRSLVRDCERGRERERENGRDGKRCERYMFRGRKGSREVKKRVGRIGGGRDTKVFLGRGRRA